MKTYIHSHSPFNNTDIYGNPDEFDNLGTDNKAKWQFLVNRGQVRIAKGDTFITQEGNVYDFGGYWVYNLGNCYIENHMAQKLAPPPPPIPVEPQEPTEQDYPDDPTGYAQAKDDYDNNLKPNYDNEKKEYDYAKSSYDDKVGQLNHKPGVYDMLDTGGPNWTAWGVVGTSASKNELREMDKKEKYGNWDPGNVWVEKKFNGCSYGYNHKSHSIEVNDNCSTHNINVSGRHIEEKYSGTGHRTLHSVSESGHKEEKKYNRETGILISDSETTDSGSSIKSFVTKYDRNTGGLVSFSDTTDWGHQVSNTKFTIINKSYMDISVSGEEYFKCNLAAKAGFTFNLAGSVDLKFNLVQIPFKGEFTFAPFDFTVKSGFALGADIDLRYGGAFKLKPSGNIEFDAVGLKAIVEAPVKAKKEEITLVKAILNVKNTNLSLEDHTCNINNGFSIYT